jgi:hypothetical protein
MRVGACEGFPYNSVRLVLLTNINRYKVDSNTFFFFFQVVKPSNPLSIENIPLHQLKTFLRTLFLSLRMYSLKHFQCKHFNIWPSKSGAVETKKAVTVNVLQTLFFLFSWLDHSPGLEPTSTQCTHSNQEESKREGMVDPFNIARITINQSRKWKPNVRGVGWDGKGALGKNTWQDKWEDPDWMRKETRFMSRRC